MKYAQTIRTFRYGNGECLTSKYEVTFPVDVLGEQKSLTASVVPGDAPLLIARNCFEEWGFVVDFRNKAAMLTDSPDRGWIPLKQSGRGHLLLELIPKLARANFDEALFGDADREQWDIETAGSDGTTDEDDGTTDEETSDAYLTSSCYKEPARDVG